MTAPRTQNETVRAGLIGEAELAGAWAKYKHYVEKSKAARAEGDGDLADFFTEGAVDALHLAEHISRTNRDLTVKYNALVASIAEAN